MHPDNHHEGEKSVVHRPLLLALCLALLVTSCGPRPEGLAAPADETHPPVNALTLIDALGREIHFASLPERIVIAGRATALLADAFYMFPEATERLVAIEHRAQRNASFLPLVDPAFGEKVQLEKNAGPEQIAPLHPDAVLLKSFMAETLGDSLEELGIPVVYLDLETPEQFLRDVQTMGTLLGNEDRAHEIILLYESHLARLEQALWGIPEAEKPSILLLQYIETGGEVAFQVPSAAWLQTALVRLAGGIPAWTEAAQEGGWTVVGFEQIAAWNPDQIYIVYYPDDPTPIVDHLKTDPKWMALRAVQEGEIHGFAGDFLSWDQPDTRWILGLAWLATKVHPERTAEIDMIEETRRFYSLVYRLDETMIRGQIMPFLNVQDP